MHPVIIACAVQEKDIFVVTGGLYEISSESSLIKLFPFTLGRESVVSSTRAHLVSCIESFKTGLPLHSPHTFYRASCPVFYSHVLNYALSDDAFQARQSYNVRDLFIIINSNTKSIIVRHVQYNHINTHPIFLL